MATKFQWQLKLQWKPKDPKDPTRGFGFICNMGLFLFVPDPRKWSREEVREWLMWMSLRHKVPIDPARFQMNGKALCLMSLQMFAFRVPIGGKLLYKDFQLRLTSAFHRELYETKS